MGKMQVFLCKMQRRENHVEFFVKSQKLEEAMRSYAQNVTEHQALTRNGPLTQLTYRVGNIELPRIHLDIADANKLGVETEVITRADGLRKPPVYRDNPYMVANLSWLTLVGTGDGVRVEIPYPISIKDIDVTGKILTRVVVALLETLLQPFELAVEIFEEDLNTP